MTRALLAVTEPFDPARRGNHAVYRAGERNHCPGCGRTQWLVGRQSAECAYCATALPLEASQLWPEANGRILYRGKAIGTVTRLSFDRPRLVKGQP